jgi:hypothetical protein
MKPAALLLSEETLRERTVVSNEVDTKYLQQVITDCQETHVQELIGTPLYKRLVAGVDAGDLSNDEKELLDDYITNVLMFYVLSELPMALSYKFTNKSLLKKTAENAESASMSDIERVMKYYMNKAEFHAQRTIKYLCEKTESGSLFPQYTEYTKDLKPKRKGYKCAFVLKNC